MGHSGPPRACLLPWLIGTDGDNWAKMLLTENPGALARVRRDSVYCTECQADLARLFPQGLPESTWEGDPPELEELIAQLRDQRP